MRLPLRHQPPSAPAIAKRCAYLEALANACVGLPLGPAADLLLADAGRGKHGNALQWHLGLPARDGAARLDWEDRIEIKLVSIWTRRDGSITCDKLKICDVSVDPARKLDNVLWVFADRITRVVWATCQSARVGRLHESLLASYTQDPHFDAPALFVEARESKDKVSPAYYLSNAWFEELGLLPQVPALCFDGTRWGAIRKEYGDRSPRMLPTELGDAQVQCPHCRAVLSFDPELVASSGWALATHPGSVSLACEGSATIAYDRRRVPEPRACSRADQVAALAGQCRHETLMRLADEVPEPDDHGH